MSTPHCCFAGGLITGDSKQQLCLPLSFQASVEIHACLAVCYSADHAERITTSDMTGQRASWPISNTVSSVFQSFDIVNGVKPVKLSSQVTLEEEYHQSGLYYKPIGFRPNMSVSVLLYFWNRVTLDTFRWHCLSSRFRVFWGCSSEN